MTLSIRLRALAAGACVVAFAAGSSTAASGAPIPDDTIATVAGDGDHGPWGDGSPAIAASLSDPQGVAMAADGVVYIADTGNNRVRAIDRDGVMRFVAGAFTSGGFRGDGGHPSGANLTAPTDVALGPDGSLYIADSGNGRIRQISPDRLTITTFAGGGACGGGSCGDGGAATAAQLVSPHGVAVGRDGSVYVADRGARRIRKVAPGGTITTIAGSGGACASGPCGDGGPAAAAEFDAPVGVDVGWDGTVYVADLTAERVRSIAPDGTISAFAGSGVRGHSGDGGPALLAQIANAGAVEVTRDGSVLISETHWGTVRRVDAGGTITTVAGNSTLGWGFSGDGGPPTTAQLDEPVGLTVGRDGTTYVADRDNDRIRAFKLAGWNPNGPTPAAPVLTAPAAGATVTTATPTLAVSTVAGAEVTFAVDGLPVATATADGAGTAQVLSSPLADGAHELTATVTVGASLASDPSLARAFTVDTTVDPPRRDDETPGGGDDDGGDDGGGDGGTPGGGDGGTPGGGDGGTPGGGSGGQTPVPGGGIVPTPGVGSTPAPAVIPPARPAAPAPPTRSARPVVCRVPRLAGLTLARARRRLRAAHCRLGRVRYKQGRGDVGRVVAVTRRPGTRLGKDAKIGVTVVRRTRR